MAKDFNSPQVVEGYDVHIRRLIPGYEVVHQQIKALLKAYLPEVANILIVGCGTGYELRYLLETFPKWQFTATELSSKMLEKAKTYISDLQAEDRVHFVLGDIATLPENHQFDAALSVLVTHFVGFEHKTVFLANIGKRLKSKGLLITFDLTQMHTDKEQQALKNICEENGLTEFQTGAMLKRLKEDFYALTSVDTIHLLEQSGFTHIQSFTQILCYQGFIAFSKS